MYPNTAFCVRCVNVCEGQIDANLWMCGLCPNLGRCDRGLRKLGMQAINQ